ncbi:MAG: Lrp/AsnC family transcriptional regulator [Clostridia bacterium]|nr:Lrp/AsnC family transcriptional regulator [Clostridia bacterium]
MERKLLELLETNSKISIEELKEELCVSELEILETISRLEKEKIICGYNSIINWDKITDQKVNALIEVRVTPQRGIGYDRLADRISRFDEVSSVYLISGGYDFMVVINGKSMREISSFVFEKISTIDMIQSITTHFVLKKYKDHRVYLEEKPNNKRKNIVL